MPREGGAPAITRESGDLPVAVDPLRGRGVPGGRGAFSSSERRFVRSQWCAAVASRKTRMNPPYRLFLLATAALAAPALAQETPADVVVTAAGAPQSVNETEIGRAPCRERVCQYVEISVVPVSLKQKNKKER